ncbi:MAG: WhiB family transcriptional regulator [Actinomycetota bacterium]|nr:WhiB family transcriptional regulator [Actinomycetota bacterium]
MVPTTGWMDRAGCRDQDPEAFFVRGAAQSRKAVRICQRCVVRDLCLNYAVEHEIDLGIWGGLTERQRRRLLRTQAAERAGAAV